MPMFYATEKKEKPDFRTEKTRYKWMQKNGVPKTDKNGNMQQFFI